MKTRKYRIKEEKTLSDAWGKLQAVTYDPEGADGKMQEHTGELYNTGNVAAVLLYNRARDAVLLVRQFRITALFSSHPDGMLTEAPAGKIEGGLSPEQTARKEIFEEAGYTIGKLEPVMELYMSPGAFTEKLSLFTAPYTPSDKRTSGEAAAARRRKARQLNWKRCASLKQW